MIVPHLFDNWVALVLFLTPIILILVTIFVILPEVLVWDIKRRLFHGHLTDQEQEWLRTFDAMPSSYRKDVIRVMRIRLDEKKRFDRERRLSKRQKLMKFLEKKSDGELEAIVQVVEELETMAWVKEVNDRKEK